MTKNRFAISVTVLLLMIGSSLLVWHFGRHALEGDKVRTLIAAKTGRKLVGRAGLLPLKARGFAIVSPGLVATASPRALSEMRVDQLSANFSLLELWRGKWRIERLSVRHAQIAYGRGGRAPA